MQSKLVKDVDDNEYMQLPYNTGSKETVTIFNLQEQVTKKIKRKKM